MARLTLNLDERVVRRAKRYAARHGMSVSRLVEQFLVLVSKPDEDLPPILARLRTELKGASADRTAYKKHLQRKYQ